MAKGDEVLDRGPGGGDIVDVDTRSVDPRQGALDDDRGADRDKQLQLAVVDTRPGHDQPVGAM
jgi:hypothetical protein